MSLVFLKNKQISENTSNERDKPYHFTDYFSTPLRIKKNSQVAFISSAMSKQLDAEVIDEDMDLYSVIGIPELNNTFQINLANPTLPPQGVQNWTQFAQLLEETLNNQQTQSGFLNTTQDAQGNNTNGFIITYNNATNKFKLECKQRPLEKLNIGVNILPFSFPDMGWSKWKTIDLNPIGVSNIGDVDISVEAGTGSGNPNDVGWTLSVRDNFGIPTIANPTGGYTTTFSNTEVRRNGGSVIFHPANQTMVLPIDRRFPPNQYFGLTSRHSLDPTEFLGGNYIYPPTPLAPFSYLNNLNGGAVLATGQVREISSLMIGIKIDRGRGVVVMNNLNIDSTTDETESGDGRIHLLEMSAPFPLVVNRPHFFKITATTPYQYKVEHSINYNPVDGTGVWTLHYDMATDDLHFGSYYGDICAVSYLNYRENIVGIPAGGAEMRIRGEFSNRMGYRPTAIKPNHYYDLPYIQLGYMRVRNILPNPIIETDYENAREAKQIKWCVGALEGLTQRQNFLRWVGLPETTYIPNFTIFNENEPTDTHIGITLGNGNSGIIELETTAPPSITAFVDYIFEPPYIVVGGRDIKQVHIQLLNLPITSYNGITASQVKDIAVVPLFNQGTLLQLLISNQLEEEGVFIYHQAEKNWIDLDNTQIMELNFLEVWITYDNNLPATNLINETGITIMFRQKPETDTTY